MTIYRRPDPIPRPTQKSVSASKLEPIRESRTDLSTLAAQHIFSAIVSKNWAQTGLLPREDILGEELSVSRTVVREAVKSLSSKSIVETKRRRGTAILNQSDWNFVDREMIGWMSASESFPDVGSQLINALAMTQSSLLAQISERDLDTSALREQARMIDGTPVEAAIAALAFHRTAAQIVMNDFLLSLTTSMIYGLHAHHIEWLVQIGFGANPQQYTALCDAIEAKDTDAIRTLNTEIFSNALPTVKDRRAPAGVSM
ncbi:MULTISPECIES: FadR/GntR family transcriptional regulator [Pacificibacter]|uniref:FadR/GntR family transcriptional regulator n=1 Tax=Pacificibacter TaxID=1042323 RepID=UPI001C08D5D8|nr:MULTISPECIES: GntR family transcriptional regulator [Pacificibacter]MBU2937420.1 GntR family transcriptional regulator [Pacificibacter marinus]MDO6617062.1 GntR family transcriptional regulator [Pacificibacter sp. 1_MG-2023]